MLRRKRAAVAQKRRKKRPLVCGEKRRGVADGRGRRERLVSRCGLVCLLAWVGQGHLGAHERAAGGECINQWAFPPGKKRPQAGREIKRAKAGRRRSLGLRAGAEPDRGPWLRRKWPIYRDRREWANDVLQTAKARQRLECFVSEIRSTQESIVAGDVLSLDVCVPA